ncbi:protein STPG4 [Rhincodon typus]|uniref:protein STPG4 n=1 Tax=Rhincodon typus TaxID=259920 RepID=UPI00202E3517|nr:protein STPG4 [Rhincodon typus]
MAGSVANNPTEKVARKNHSLSNKSEIKSKVREVRNAKKNRNSKQKSKSSAEQASTREGWWRENVKDTSIPEKYPIKDFIQEGLLNPVKRNFKTRGRDSTTVSDSQSSEQLAKPDQSTTALTEVEKKSPSQALKKATKKKIVHNVPQKDTISAASYSTRTPVFEKSPLKLKVDFLSHSSQGNFRSSVKRFPTIYFVPKEGPAPGHYNVKSQTLSQTMTSSFQSKVPRFLPTPSKTPGPGTYDPIRRQPSWANATSVVCRTVLVRDLR